MNKIKAFSFAALIGMTLSGCNDVLDENINVDAASKNTIENGLAPIIYFANQLVYDHAEYGIYLSQCLTTTSKSETGSNTYRNGWGNFLVMQRHPQWRRHFFDVCYNGRILKGNAGEVGSPNYALVSRALELMSTQLTTDGFGDMPRTHAYVSNTPRYDTQASIYAWMFEEIDQLVTDIEDCIANPPATMRGIDATIDRIYAGDLNKWKGFVLAIKARLLLRNLPNIDWTPATCQKIIDAAQAAIDCWRSGDIYDHNGIARDPWFGNEPRFYYDGGLDGKNAVWGPGSPRYNGWESYGNGLDEHAVPSRLFMQDFLGICNPTDETSCGLWAMKTGYGADPRLALLFTPAEGQISVANETKKVMLRYLENNIGAPQGWLRTVYPSLWNGAYAAAIDCYNAMFTMEELYFIKAEAHYHKGEKEIACALAKEATQKNIERHFTRFQQDNPGAYPFMENKPYSLPAAQSWWEQYMKAFLDNETGKQVVKAEDNGQGHWYFNPSQFTLSDLMIQKYIAMYMQPEQWTDVRRYHYSNNDNKVGGNDAGEIVYPTMRRPFNLYKPYFVDGLTQEEQYNTWIQRINYDPETEERYNAAELERLGASMNYKWLLKPMNWAEPRGQRKSLTAE